MSGRSLIKPLPQSLHVSFIGSRLPKPVEYEEARDSEGVYLRPRTSLTLLEKLLIRAGSMPAPAPSASKPRRGRKPKSSKGGNSHD